MAPPTPAGNGRGSNQYVQRGSGSATSPARSLAATAGARAGVSDFVSATPLPESDREVDDSFIQQDTWESFERPDPAKAATLSDPIEAKAWSPNPIDRSDAAEHPNASEAVLQRSIKDTDVTVRCHAAANRQASPSVLQAAMSDPDSHVRFSAVNNPSATADILERGLKDPDRVIYLAAWERTHTSTAVGV